MSFGPPRPTSNPYLPLLLRELETLDGLDPVLFSWREALLGRWEVLHVQWPETLIGGSSWWRRRVNEARYALLLTRTRRGGRALVLTAHNVGSHTPTSRPGARLVALTERWADHLVVLNDHTPVGGRAATTVPHGHYRDWYPRPADVAARPGRLLYFGLVRQYKGIEELLDAATVPGAELELRIVGAPADPILAERVARRTALAEHAESDLRHLGDGELAAEIAAASLVVLPYRELHNSGAVLLALSLDRPVLVPANPVTDALADEVGPAWVQRFTGALTADVLSDALARAEAVTGRPDLSAREWGRTASDHLAVYRAALDARRAR